MSAVHPVFMGFAEEFRAPGLPTIAPDRYASVLKLQVQDLAKLAGVHRTTVTENPTNARLQAFLRDALKVLTAALEVAGDRDRAIYWFRSVPIPEFGHQTAEELVGKGRADAVLRYLTSIASGSSG